MRTMLKTFAAGVLAAVPLLLSAGPAHATTNVALFNGQLTINSGDLADNITISVGVNVIKVFNANDTLVPNFACTRIDTRTVHCPIGSVNRLFVQVKGGDDIVTNNTSLPVRAFLGIGSDTYNGGSNEDFVTGDAGGDTMSGNGGNDILDGRTGTDTAHGGLGTDVCIAEAETGCELD
ncbi:hypothetical protein [Streptosporangium longisporum]|uniref:Calcium-binding protein n=1 Tax=Streptosporangium longisporum TaxID=46187 RepID=A0ABN3XSX3_9ACTN